MSEKKEKMKEVESSSTKGYRKSIYFRNSIVTKPEIIKVMEWMDNTKDYSSEIATIISKYLSGEIVDGKDYISLENHNNIMKEKVEELEELKELNKEMQKTILKQCQILYSDNPSLNKISYSKNVKTVVVNEPIATTELSSEEAVTSVDVGEIVEEEGKTVVVKNVEPSTLDSVSEEVEEEELEEEEEEGIPRNRELFNDW